MDQQQWVDHMKETFPEATRFCEVMLLHLNLFGNDDPFPKRDFLEIFTKHMTEEDIATWRHVLALTTQAVENKVADEVTRRWNVAIRQVSSATSDFPADQFTYTDHCMAKINEVMSMQDAFFHQCSIVQLEQFEATCTVAADLIRSSHRNGGMPN